MEFLGYNPLLSSIDVYFRSCIFKKAGMGKVGNASKTIDAGHNIEIDIH